MRHAIMIMAHKDIGQLCHLVKYFSQDCDVFIHLDKKYELTERDIEQIRRHPQVRHLEQTYEVHWGGTSVLDCEMALIRKAYNGSNADYFHLISGQDYPIRPLNQFLQFFEEHRDEERNEYIQFTHMPHPRWEHNTFRRLQYYYPYDMAGDKPNPRSWVAKEVLKQQMRGVKRPLPDEFDHIYCGSQWFSVSRNAIKILLEYTEQQPSFYKRMWMTFAPEECYVATVLVNKLDEKKIENNNLRFIRWKYENGNSPANLDKKHFRYLIEGNRLFARKIERSCSEELLDEIDHYLHHDNQIRSLSTGGWDYDGFLSYGFDKDFCQHIGQLWCDIGAKSAIDMGCGAGIYVAEWRERGLSFAGYDANPHTPKLSSMLLPEGDEPCGVADITEEIIVDSQFDMVICKDVLPYIPESMDSIAIHNLAQLSSRIVLVSWNKDCRQQHVRCRNLQAKYLVSMFETEGFVVEHYLTARVRMTLANANYCIFIKKGKQIINN